MEMIRVKAVDIQKFGIQFLVASMEAIGVMFLFAKLANKAIEQWDFSLTLILYLLLVVLLLLIFRKKEV